MCDDVRVYELFGKPNQEVSLYRELGNDVQGSRAARRGYSETLNC